VAPRACVLVYARVLVPPNLYKYTYMNHLPSYCTSPPHAVRLSNSSNPMGDVISARVVRGGQFGGSHPVVSPVRTPVLLTARRDLRPLDHNQR